MIHPADFVKLLNDNDISFFTGVPDSLLKDFCAYLTDYTPPANHLIAANEGSAVAMAVGYNLATGKTGLVYMQNSGLGNAVNPLLSLVDPDVYGIPVLLVIGWRGEPGFPDEPQHKKQGQTMLSLLTAMEIPYEILPDSSDAAGATLQLLCSKAQELGGAVALIVRNRTFEPYAQQNVRKNPYRLSREEAIKIIIDKLSGDEILVTTTGQTSREIYEYRDAINQGHANDFLTVGSMGHCSQIAFSLALQQSERNIICIDGDGAFLMHMGGLALSGLCGSSNYLHIVINNGAHDSVGGQPTCGFELDFLGIARSCGYKLQLRAETAEAIVSAMELLLLTDGPSFLEIRVHTGSRGDLGRPKISPLENKRLLMNLLKR